MTQAVEMEWPDGWDLDKEAQLSAVEAIFDEALAHQPLGIIVIGFSQDGHLFALTNVLDPGDPEREGATVALADLLGDGTLAAAMSARGLQSEGVH